MHHGHAADHLVRAPRQRQEKRPGLGRIGRLPQDPILQDHDGVRPDHQSVPQSRRHVPRLCQGEARGVGFGSLAGQGRFPIVAQFACPHAEGEADLVQERRAPRRGGGQNDLGARAGIHG